MKAIVLNDRLKQKDAYDIYYCLKQYSDRLDDLAAEFRPHINNGLIREGLEKLGKNIASEAHVGFRFVADFDEIIDEEDRKQIEMDTFDV